MTKEEIEQMPAGREMDICIAELITGKSRYEARFDPTVRDGEPQFHFGYPHGHDFAPNYSTDIAAAWQVFVWGLTSFGSASVVADMEAYGRGTFTRGHAEEVVYVRIDEVVVCAPVCLAICRAALIAVQSDAAPNRGLNLPR